MRDRCAMHETNAAWATKKDSGESHKLGRTETQTTKNSVQNERFKGAKIMRDKCAVHKTDTAWGNLKRQAQRDRATNIASSWLIAMRPDKQSSSLNEKGQISCHH